MAPAVAETATLSVAVVGGTGPQGSGLGYRFARAGHRVTLGSRSKERAAEKADELNRRLPADAARMSGEENRVAAAQADVVLLALPFAGHDETVAALAPALAGKIVVSCVNPLGFDKRGPYGLALGESSASENAQRLVPDARMVGAFHHLSASTLLGDADLLEHEDVMVCGDDQEAKDVVAGLARAVTGRVGIDVGPLRLTRQLEPLTAVLISINKRYKVQSGLRITGFPDAH